MPYNDESPFDVAKVYVPRSILAELQRLSQEKGLPISRLILYAIDNELGSHAPFKYDCEVPVTPYKEHAYTEEAQKIYRYMYKFSAGLSQDQLTACRRDIGIPSKDAFLHGLRELLNLRLLEYKKPSGKVKFKSYKDDYKVLRFAKDAEALRKKEITDGTEKSESVLDEA